MRLLISSWLSILASERAILDNYCNLLNRYLVVCGCVSYSVSDDLPEVRLWSLNRYLSWWRRLGWNLSLSLCWLIIWLRLLDFWNILSSNWCWLFFNKITVAEAAVYLISVGFWGDVNHRLEGLLAGVAEEWALSHSVRDWGYLLLLALVLFHFVSEFLV